MRNRYVVAYDVRDPKRLRQTHQKMKGFGDSLQFSVFLCELSAKEKVLLEEALSEIINFKEDQVLVVDLGPVDGHRANAMEALGRQVLPRSREVVVV
ncbi:MAG: CRISPR-associated endonuclease Cas2 [Caldilineaceae bacterium]|nr:CRISPR-associated endonuclease Cas2 [Caldilineaceae bacterium]